MKAKLTVRLPPNASGLSQTWDADTIKGETLNEITEWLTSGIHISYAANDVLVQGSLADLLRFARYSSHE